MNVTSVAHVRVCDPDDPELKRDRKVRPFSMFEATEQPAAGLRKNQSSDDLVRDAQVRGTTPLMCPQDTHFLFLLCLNVIFISFESYCINLFSF